MKRLLRFWADLNAPIDRATFVTNGLALAVVKYLGGGALIWLATDDFPAPLAYWSALSVSASSPYALEAWLLPALGVWTLHTSTTR